MHLAYIISILCCQVPRDLTHYNWCLGIITDPILEGEALDEVTYANEYEWVTGDVELLLDDGEQKRLVG